jgi:hypothetical protein
MRTFFEQAPGWKTLKARLEDWAPKYGLYDLHITWTDTTNVRSAKSLRIEQIEVAMQRDKVRLFAGMPGYDKLVKQLLSFPKGSHDDFTDGLAQCLIADTGFWAQSTPQPRTAISEIRRHFGFDNPQVPDDGDSSFNMGGTDQSWK